MISAVCCVARTGGKVAKRNSSAGSEEPPNKADEAPSPEVPKPQSPTEESKTPQTPTEEPKTRKSVAQLARLRQSVVQQGGSESIMVEQNLKAGYQAVDDHAQSGTVIGLSSGPISDYAVQRLRKKLEAGELKDIIVVPMSKRAEEQAASAAIPLGTPKTHPEVDLAIDEADEVDEDLNLTKGSSGMVLRQKMVARKAKKKIVVVDATRLSDRLGTQPVPVEIVPFGFEENMRKLEQLSAFQGCGCEAKLRHGNVENSKDDGEEIAVTETGNYIVDLKFKTQLQDAAAAAEELTGTVGVVEHGLFINMVDSIIVSAPDGVSVVEPGDVLV